MWSSFGMGEENKKKRVMVHVGPHKTGSTSVQKWMQECKPFLAKRKTVLLHNAETHRAARLLCSQKFEEAEELLESISAKISVLDAETVILSQEDFAGDLPGRTRARAIYPRLAKNLRVIRRALGFHRVEFIFFERDPIEWLRSCYNQHLIHRTAFHSFDAFTEFLGGPPDWDRILLRATDALKGSLHREPFSKNPENGVRTILSLAGIHEDELPSKPGILNQSPSMECIFALERINKSSSFPSTAWFAKQLIIEQYAFDPKSSATKNPRGSTKQIAQVALPALFDRATQRIPIQSQEDLLPDPNVDLKALLTRHLPENVTLPEIARHQISDQSLLLDYHFRGKSELAKLNALTISYLRRNTPYTDKARTLFQRIWNECGILLVNELTSRWLISTLQTFLDHGISEEQKLVGGCGYFYANMIKIYEGERAIEGLAQDSILLGTEPSTPNRFRGLDRYKVGGTDLLLNTNALALEISASDRTAGIVLQEFLLRVKNSGNVFTRSDATRIAHEIEVPDFEDTWSFFVRPDRRSDAEE
jgi:hypothetical protein